MYPLDSAHALARTLGERLRGLNASLVCAESCTGGGVAYAITEVPGASLWFDRGYVVYANEAKQSLLGVPADLLQQHGAVSEACARAMARGALPADGRACASLAVTGIAGPDGGSPLKPVGTVCFAWAWQCGGAADTPGAPLIRSITRYFPGDRAAVRVASIEYALSGMIEVLTSQDKPGHASPESPPA